MICSLLTYHNPRIEGWRKLFFCKNNSISILCPVLPSGRNLMSQSQNSPKHHPPHPASHLSYERAFPVPQCWGWVGSGPARRLDHAVTFWSHPGPRRVSSQVPWLSAPHPGNLPQLPQAQSRCQFYPPNPPAPTLLAFENQALTTCLPHGHPFAVLLKI